MRIGFKQGIIRPLYKHLNPGDANIPSYIQKLATGNDLYIKATSKDPIIVNFSHGTNNYLYEEISFKLAWNNFLGNPPYWLYWDIDAEDGSISYGYTRLEPEYGNELPSNPANDQHFFLVPKKTINVWNAIKQIWEVKIRVFSTKYDPTLPPYFNYTGFLENKSQVQLEQAVDAGYIIYSNGNHALKDGDTFVTTATNLISQGSFSNRNKIGIEKNSLIAIQTIPKNYCVTYDNNNIKVASYIDLKNPASGVCSNTILRNQVGTFITKGYIHDPANFSWEQPPNTTLFLGKSGELSTVSPDKFSIQKMGYIVDRHTVYIDIGPQILIDPFAHAPPAPTEYCTNIECPKEYCTNIECPKEYCTNIECPKEYCTNIECPEEYCTNIECPIEYCTNIECPKEYCADIVCPIEYCTNIECPEEYCTNIECPIEYCTNIECP